MVTTKNVLVDQNKNYDGASSSGNSRNDKHNNNNNNNNKSVNDDVDEDDNKYFKSRRTSPQSSFFVNRLIVVFLLIGCFLYYRRIVTPSIIQRWHDQYYYYEIDLELATKVKHTDQYVRQYKQSHPNIMMEVDPVGLQLTRALQDATRNLIHHRYGIDAVDIDDTNNRINSKRKHQQQQQQQQQQVIRVVVQLTYPESIVKIYTKKPNQQSNGNSNNNNNNNNNNKGQFIIEMAPISLLPCSVLYFLELVRTYQHGDIMRNAPHVLQATAYSTSTTINKATIATTIQHDGESQISMPFQEYSALFPHEKYTTGYAGRPSGPDWYVSIMNNTDDHGPGSQQKANPYEADSNFGFVIQSSIDSGVLDILHSVTNHNNGNNDEWLDKNNYIHIDSMTIMINTKTDPDQFHEWKPPKGSSSSSSSSSSLKILSTVTN